MISKSGISDVRGVLDHYNKEIDPLDTFKLNQAKLAVFLYFFEVKFDYVIII